MKISRRSLFGGGFVARQGRDGRNDGHGGGDDEFLMIRRNGPADRASALSRGLRSKLSFCTSCVMAWRKATGDDEDDEGE